MITLTGLNGATILVGPKTIFRLRRAIAVEAPESTKVEYSGGYIYTLEPIDDLVARLSSVGTNLITLTTRSGSAVLLNPAAISRVRDALPINGPGTEIVVGGQYQHVTESVGEVEALIV